MLFNTHLTSGERPLKLLQANLFQMKSDFFFSTPEWFMYKWIINFYSASPWSLSLFTLKYWSCCVAGFDVIFSPLPGRPRRRAPSVWLINVSQATGRTSHVWKVDLIRFSPSFLWKTCQLVTVCFMIFFYFYMQEVLLLFIGGNVSHCYWAIRKQK